MKLSKAKIVALVIIICLAPIFIKIYDTNTKYQRYGEIWHSINDKFEYNGISYELEGIKEYTIDMFVDEFGVNAEAFNVYDKLDATMIKFYVVKVNLEVTKEDYNFDLSKIAYCTPYFSSYSAEYGIMNYLNESRIMYKSELEVGDTTEYYFVYKMSDMWYSKEDLLKLTADDFAIAILDDNAAEYHFMCNTGKIPKYVD